MSIPRFTSDTLSKETFLSALSEQGFAIVEDVLQEERCEQTIPELEKAIQQEALFHGTKRYKDYGMLLACPNYGDILKIADNRPLMSPF